MSNKMRQVRVLLTQANGKEHYVITCDGKMTTLTISQMTRLISVGMRQLETWAKRNKRSGHFTGRSNKDAIGRVYGPIWANLAPLLRYPTQRTKRED